ncbi:MAG TPA: hypothetical protein VEL76_24745 [Gemmataceae bacterium]|nr:hypothetical protein [Gemmataceae bacterium]
MIGLIRCFVAAITLGLLLVVGTASAAAQDTKGKAGEAGQQQTGDNQGSQKDDGQKQENQNDDGQKQNNQNDDGQKGDKDDKDQGNKATPAKGGEVKGKQGADARPPAKTPAQPTPADLERRLEELLRQIEALRREIRKQ